MARKYIKKPVLLSCIWGTEWKVFNCTLHCYVDQRSADLALGLTFNVSQYATLLKMFAKVSNLEARKFKL
jgi:thymidylate synthase